MNDDKTTKQINSRSKPLLKNRSQDLESPWICHRAEAVWFSNLSREGFRSPPWTESSSFPCRSSCIEGWTSPSPLQILASGSLSSKLRPSCSGRLQLVCSPSTLLCKTTSKINYASNKNFVKFTQLIYSPESALHNNRLPSNHFKTLTYLKQTNCSI